MSNRAYADSDAYGFRCHKNDNQWCDDYIISWSVDFTYPGDRLRYPRHFKRFTDLAGAKRFCKKHDIPMPTTGEYSVKKEKGERK